jgi:tight adherence protein B
MLLLTNSKQISIAISALSTSIPFMINKQRAEKVMRERESAWPEVIDSLVSALQSGVSISDAVLALAEHAPVALRPNFIRVKMAVQQGEGLELALKREKEDLKSAISDQVFETLIVAKEFGGRDSNNALRLLSEFVRDDLDVLEEIRTKFGWIKNSAALATVAPWILLVLLSSQRSTVEAFSTSSGVKILACGVIMTALAYLWMERVGRIPIAVRALR